MKTQTEIFAHNLKVLLEKKHKSQSDLARFLKVTPTTVSRWANGESLPRSPMIDRICGFLVCTTEDLMVDRTRQSNLLPEDILAEVILERPLLMQLFVMADKADDDAIRKCIALLGERK